MIGRDYEILSCLGEGAFGKVYKARRRNSDELVAIKCIKTAIKSWEEACKSAELAALRKLKHSCVVQLKELIRETKDGSLYYVFEYLDSDLLRLLKMHPKGLEEAMATELSRQVFAGLAHIHQHGFFHRDIKPDNVLYDTARSSIRIADFGEARLLRARPPFTEYVGTRWYRAPECLLGDGNYSSPVDVWAAGLVFAELLNGVALFRGTSSIDQLSKIFKVFGVPGRDWPEFSRLAEACRFQLPKHGGCGLKQVLPRSSAGQLGALVQILEVNPRRRPTTKRILEYACFVSRPEGVSDSESRSGFNTLAPKVDAAQQLTLPKKGGVSDSESRSGFINLSPTVDPVNQLTLPKQRHGRNSCSPSSEGRTGIKPKLDADGAALRISISDADASALNLTAALDEILAASPQKVTQELDLTAELSKMLSDSSPCSVDKDTVSKALVDACSERRGSAGHAKADSSQSRGGCVGIDAGSGHSVDEAMALAHELNIRTPKGLLQVSTSEWDEPAGADEVATGLAAASGGSSGSCLVSPARDGPIGSDAPTAERTKAMEAKASNRPDDLETDTPQAVSPGGDFPSRPNSNEADASRNTALGVNGSPSMELEAPNNSGRNETNLLRPERTKSSKKLGCLFLARRDSRLCCMQ